MIIKRPVHLPNFRRNRLLFAIVSVCLASPMLPAQNNGAASPASSRPAGAAPAPAPSSATSPQTRTLAFDVATIKPVAPDARPTHGFVGIMYRPDGLEASSLALPELLCYAYGYKGLRFDGQVSGGPKWVVSQRYDIVAKMSDADSAEFQKLGKDEQEQWRETMMRSLLAERFHLILHPESKQVPVYDLVVAKGGIKIRDAATDTTPPLLRKRPDGTPEPGMRSMQSTTIVQAEPISRLVLEISIPGAQVGRPVIDKTGLTGTYNYTLDWSIYSAAAAANPSADSEATSIFTALGKLGLKLQPSTSSMETLLIDRVEQPTDN